MFFALELLKVNIFQVWKISAIFTNVRCTFEFIMKSHKSICIATNSFPFKYSDMKTYFPNFERITFVLYKKQNCLCLLSLNENVFFLWLLIGSMSLKSSIHVEILVKSIQYFSIATKRKEIGLQNWYTEHSEKRCVRADISMKLLCK